MRVFYVQGAVVGSIAWQGSSTPDANTLDLTGSGPVQMEIKMVRGLGHIDGVVLKDGNLLPERWFCWFPMTSRTTARRFAATKVTAMGPFH